MANEVASFFDSLAPDWDKGNRLSEEEKELFLAPIAIKEGDKVLDLGCGTGVITSTLARKSHRPVIAIDVSSKMIEMAKKKNPQQNLLLFKNIDFYDYEEEDFDWIVCFNAYPHFLDKEAFINKLAQCLRKGGHFAICHNRSREVLRKHHSGEAIAHLTRNLLPIEEEMQDYLPYFEIELAKEDDYSYWIIGRKL